MRVLFLQETDWINKTVGQHHHLAEMLSLRGHEVRAIDYDLFWRKIRHGRGNLVSKRETFQNVAKTHEGANVTVIRPSIVKIPILDYMSLVISHKREINRQIREFAPDAIVGFSILNSHVGQRAADKHQIPFIYYWIDVLHQIIPQQFFRPIGRLVESQTLKRADRVMTINESLQDVTVALGAPPGKSHVLRAGVDFKPLGQDEAAKVRREYGLAPEDVVLFFVGWLYHFAGLKEILAQMGATSDTLTKHNLKFLIVGEGDAYSELQNLRTNYRLEDNVILTGKKPYHDLPPLIAAADICLLPAYPDEEIMQNIVPIKLYEYMAMKKPVIATRLPGILREFGQGNGVVYVERPEDVIAKALEMVQTGVIEREGEKARRFVEKYSWDKIAEEFERIIGEAIMEKKNG